MGKEIRIPDHSMEWRSRGAGKIIRLNLYNADQFAAQIRGKRIHNIFMRNDEVIRKFVKGKFRLQISQRELGSTKTLTTWVMEKGKYGFYTINEAHSYYKNVVVKMI